MGERTASLLITILATVIALSSSFRSSDAMDVAVYWGEGPTEVSLKAVCDTKYFSHVNLAHLTISADGPALILNGTSCGVGDKACLHIRDDILHCQRQGIKVLLSIQINGNHGNQVGSDQLAYHVIQNYLSNINDDAPLGNVMLDGVNFHVERPSPDDRFYWNEVAAILSKHRVWSRRLYLLAAAPQCAYPDETLNVTIHQSSISHVWV